jgi:hypothetical protein
MTVRAQFDGKALVPVEPVDLQAGRLYDVDVREAPLSDRVLSPQAIAQVLQSLPALASEDIDEMDSAINKGQLPIHFEDFFNGNEG